MVLADKNLPFEEEALAEALGTTSFGASIMHIPKALEALQLAGNVQATPLQGASLADLAQALSTGSQAIASVNIPGLGNHALVVESVTATHVHIRDPLPLDDGSTYAVKATDFETYWNKRALIIT